MAFAPAADDRTFATLEHRGWEALADFRHHLALLRGLRDQGVLVAARPFAATATA